MPSPSTLFPLTEDTMRYKFHNFVDALQVALDAWYFSRYGAKREDKKLSTEVMALFMRDVDGWAHMFFCKEDAEVMEERERNINYNTLEVSTNGQSKNPN